MISKIRLGVAILPGPPGGVVAQSRREHHPAKSEKNMSRRPDSKTQTTPGRRPTGRRRPSAPRSSGMERCCSPSAANLPWPACGASPAVTSRRERQPALQPSARSPKRTGLTVEIKGHLDVHDVIAYDAEGHLKAHYVPERILRHFKRRRTRRRERLAAPPGSWPLMTWHTTPPTPKPGILHPPRIRRRRLRRVVTGFARQPQHLRKSHTTALILPPQSG